MLSILIPVYNYNVSPLVEALHKQCLECKIEFEIICQDDGSNSKLNKANNKINLLENCFFISLSENIGLSSNRNLLASKAKYSNLLYIDGDSIVINKSYIQNYLDNIKNSDIIHGGRIHPIIVSSNKQKLRWKYGKIIEDKTVSQRNLAIYKTLLFNNTLIKKEHFNQIKFDSSLTKYGHEDTLFAYEVSKSNFNVKHIDNAIEHGDIDESKIFISKVKNSINNLILLDQQNKINPNFVKILGFYYSLKKYKLVIPGGLFFKIFNKLLFKQLCSQNPSLFLFNLYRISYICSLKK
ncbi:glycosyltransferase family 2 protein [Flavobacterium sp. LS1R49]|uniref:Glycosyltransferase family 2 protein n=1 Tax=Flavobacterium shii TaxID=2987687 RepID=A0A9X2ZFA3_9FLAO|nr:glycosyltransferase family 2 protein [Flavobacterium shii]MCV9928335.1 glycosyltransferase family 2 protein [Flavobacterium shii]